MPRSSKRLANNEQLSLDTLSAACSQGRTWRYWGVRPNTEGPQWSLPPRKDGHAVITPIAHSISDAARLLGVGRTKIYELISMKEIRVAKIGTRTLVPHAELV